MARLAHDPETRTTTLIWSFTKPLAPSDTQLIARLMARTIGLGYVTLRAETEHEITLTVVLTAPRTQPFARVANVQER